MPNIEIDFEVFKALTNLRDIEKTTYNDVVRRLLKLPDVKAAGVEIVAKGNIQMSSWEAKGVIFPEGTEFRANYNGEIVNAYIRNHSLIVNNKQTSSLSQAARIVTGTNVNGWVFWQCRLPGDSKWRIAQSLRNL